jgi:hypothetical protein
MYYDVKRDYIDRLRTFLLHETTLNVSEDPQHYAEHYDPNLLQGFLVWNYSAYVAKEYEFDNVQAVDFFIIPTFGIREDTGVCTYFQYLGINIDMYRPIDQTGQRLDMVIDTIADWHRTLLANSVCPISLNDGSIYMILPNGESAITHLTSQPYTRRTIRYKLDVINKI